MPVPDTVLIRQAVLQDLDDCLVLLRILFTLEADFSFDTSRQRRGLQLLLDRRNAAVLVAESRNRVIGMCTGQIVISTAEGGPSVLVEDMVVLPNQRGRGVGRSLMQAMITWAGERNCTRLQLLADRNNRPALEFYRQLNWQQTDMICLRRKPFSPRTENHADPD